MTTLSRRCFEKCFLCATCIVIALVGYNLQSHNSLLSVEVLNLATFLSIWCLPIPNVYSWVSRYSEANIVSILCIVMLATDRHFQSYFRLLFIFKGCLY